MKIDMFIMNIQIVANEGSNRFVIIFCIHVYRFAMATTHEQQRRILINVAYSLQYSLKDQIKPKHLASRFYFYFFLLYYASKYFAYTFYFLKSLYISDFFRIFFYMLFCKICSHLWPLKDVGLFSLLHTSSFGSGEQKGDYCENSFNVHV